MEVLLDAPVEVCEQRDPKGLYRKARNGQIADFTGVDAPYEPPVAAELTLKTAQKTIEQCVAIIVDYLRAKGFLDAAAEGDGDSE